MGKGIRFNCNKCNIGETIYLGCGMIYLEDKNHHEQERVVFVCPNCGEWTRATIRIDNDRIRKCKKCNTTMKKITGHSVKNAYQISKNTFPYLFLFSCKKDNEKLVPQDYFLLWD